MLKVLNSACFNAPDRLREIHDRSLPARRAVGLLLLSCAIGVLAHRNLNDGFEL